MSNEKCDRARGATSGSLWFSLVLKIWLWDEAVCSSSFRLYLATSREIGSMIFAPVGAETWLTSRGTIMKYRFLRRKTSSKAASLGAALAVPELASSNLVNRILYYVIQQC